MLRDTASYLGTFSHDAVPTFHANKRQSAIINYNNSNQLGSHWVAIYNDPTKKYIEFFDSFGVVPSAIIQKKMRATKKRILYNTSSIQPKDSNKCGFYTYLYIIMRERGMPPYDIIYQFTPNNSEENDRILIDLLEDTI